jgi:hypothetical protein
VEAGTKARGHRHHEARRTPAPRGAADTGTTRRGHAIVIVESEYYDGAFTLTVK